MDCSSPMCKANHASVLQEVKGLMEHICRLEGEIIDHIQTIGEHRDSLKALRAFYNCNGRAPWLDDISKMIDVVKEQILADVLEYGDMQSADEGMDMTDSSGPIHVVNFFAELRRKWSREAARKEARLAGEWRITAAKHQKLMKESIFRPSRSKQMQMEMKTLALHHPSSQPTSTLTLWKDRHSQKRVT